ncbi:hypothetical protein AB0O00_32635, partial [Kitasatospora sp. NPDC093558]
MICPHCSRNLLQRERTRRTCTFCRKPFALDPKLDGAGLSDLRIRRIAEKITGNGQLTCTIEQLGYATEPRGQRPAEASQAAYAGCCAGAAGLLLLLAAVLHNTVSLALLIATALILVVARYAARESAKSGGALAVNPRWGRGKFADVMVARWREVYGTLPAGVIEEERVPYGPPADGAAFALLCPDRTAAAFLRANGYLERYRARHVGLVHDLPDDLPVVVLHDASARGYRLVADARAKQPGRRVLDAGLSPVLVLDRPDAHVQLRDPARAVRWEPTAAGVLPKLTREETNWFAQGWWSPLAAVPPKRLMAVAVKAAELAVAAPATRPPLDAAEADRRRAAA